MGGGRRGRGRLPGRSTASRLHSHAARGAGGRATPRSPAADAHSQREPGPLGSRLPSPAVGPPHGNAKGKRGVGGGPGSLGTAGRAPRVQEPPAGMGQSRSTAPRGGPTLGRGPQEQQGLIVGSTAPHSAGTAALRGWELAKRDAGPGRGRGRRPPSQTACPPPRVHLAPGSGQAGCAARKARRPQACVHGWASGAAEPPHLCASPQGPCDPGSSDVGWGAGRRRTEPGAPGTGSIDAQRLSPTPGGDADSWALRA